MLEKKFNYLFIKKIGEEHPTSFTVNPKIGFTPEQAKQLNTCVEILVDGKVIGKINLVKKPKLGLDKPDGLYCSGCNEFSPYVTRANQKSGTFKCYSCRKGK